MGRAVSERLLMRVQNEHGDTAEFFGTKMDLAGVWRRLSRRNRASLATAAIVSASTKWAREIAQNLRKLGPGMMHTTADVQTWILGRLLSDKIPEDRNARLRLDRARMKAYRELELETGGRFVRRDQKARVVTWELVYEVTQETH